MIFVIQILNHERLHFWSFLVTDQNLMVEKQGRGAVQDLYPGFCVNHTLELIKSIYRPHSALATAFWLLNLLPFRLQTVRHEGSAGHDRQAAARGLRHQRRGCPQPRQEVRPRAGPHRSGSCPGPPRGRPPDGAARAALRAGG